MARLLIIMSGQQQQQQQSGAFGRDDMAALLGGGLSERLIRPPVAKASGKTLTKDMAEMNAQETAAWLQQQKKPKSSTTQRHRTPKVRKYHELLVEEQQNQLNSTKPSKEEGNQSEKNDSMKEQVQLEALQVVKATVISRPRRRRPSTSSSGSESSAPRRRRDASSSDSDSEEETRRQRLLQKRKQLQKTLPPSTDLGNEQAQMRAMLPSRLDTSTQSIKDKNQRDIRAQREKSSSSSSSSSDDESSTEESSSEEEEQVRAKPIFVPRHQRGMIKTADDLVEEEDAAEAKRKQQEENRMKESRAMVQKVLLDSAQQVGSNEDAFEGITGARNAIPDDNDRENGQELDEWEVRELERLVYELDMENALREEANERERRRNMTDEELMEDEIKSGRLNPRDNRREESTNRGGQRYFHRGAYYMDESEWEESDVRHKADAYAAAATGEDKIDKKSLPKVMQVKNFGRANQNLKYQGLAAEDTTDKQMEILPLVGPKRKQRKV